MRSHIIAGRYGPNDSPVVISKDNSITTIIDLIVGKNKLAYGIDHAIVYLLRNGVFPSEIGLDLLVLAIHVYGADTRINRKTESQDAWTREIQLIVPVSNPDLWIAEKPLLERMLGFLTGDRWSLDFRLRPLEFTNLIPTHISGLEGCKYDELSLLSGGLDSLIGAIDLMELGRIPLFISHAGDGAASHAQDTCFEYLHTYYNNSCPGHLRVWLHLPDGLIKGVASEKSSRSRSFLFFAIGVFAGTGFNGKFTLTAPENGLIAINVPLDPLRVGSLSTRTMHPFYLARWNDLLKDLKILGEIKNPYWNKTKGEMILDCANPALLRKITPFSLSCADPSKGRWQRHSIEHCGYCLPCLIRRAALLKAYGSDADPTTYSLPNLTERTLDTSRVEGQQIRSIQYIIERLSTQPRLAKLFIYKPGPLSDLSPTELNELTNVYRRGMNEVGLLLADVKT